MKKPLKIAKSEIIPKNNERKRKNKDKCLTTVKAKYYNKRRVDWEKTSRFFVKNNIIKRGALSR